MIIDLGRIDVIELFETAINQKQRSDLFTDLRTVFYHKIVEQLREAGIVCTDQTVATYNLKEGIVSTFDPIPVKYNEPVGVDFCAKYGFGYGSVSAINYQHRPYDQMPSLATFSKVKSFSIGNFLIPVKSKSLDIVIPPANEIRLTGFVNNTSPNKRKPFLALLGVTFDQKALQPLFDKYLHSDRYLLDEIKFNYVPYPVFFICRKTGKIFTCKCFENHYDYKKDLLPRIGYFGLAYDPDMSRQMESIQFLPGICHLCTNNIPNFEYGSAMYYSSFLVRYLPYYYLMNRKRGNSMYLVDPADRKKSEDELRALLGHYKIGERWASETILFQLVKEIFDQHEVIFHYRGKELKGLEIDIWLPELKIGFEYQGIQHFQPIEHWGGQTSFQKLQDNDLRKKVLCRELNYRLIEINYDEVLCKDTILAKIKAG
jgi:hypothetical protein